MRHARPSRRERLIDRLAPVAPQHAAAGLAALLVVIGIVCLAGAWRLWPLLAVPVALAAPAAGAEGLVGVLAAVGVILALLPGVGADGGTLVAGFLAFVVVGLATGSLARGRPPLERRPPARGVHDRLTGLASYAYVHEMLDLECARAERYGRPLSVVVLDIDGLRRVNEREGHETGDRLLATIGQDLAMARRRGDILGRTGGDELTLIVTAGSADAREAAERLRQAIADVVLLGPSGDTVQVTASAGVAVHRRGATAEALVEDAREALHEAKRAGGDRVWDEAPAPVEGAGDRGAEAA